MQEALETLPCVEISSVRVDIVTQEARLTVKKDGLCSVEAIKKVVKDAGFNLLAVKIRVYEVTVVKAGVGKMTLTLKGIGYKHTYDVATDVTITLDDKKANLEELKEGFPANVTMDNKFIVTRIEATSKTNQ